MLTSIFEPAHLIVILVVVLLVLGPKRLPEAGRTIGHGLKELKRAIGGQGRDGAGSRLVALPR